MKTFLFVFAASLVSILTSTQAHAQSAALCANPCGRGYAYLCEDAACRCVPKKGSSWFVQENSSGGAGSLTSTSSNAAYTCVPELHQCGCNGILDCFNMLMSLKVKCESFDCNDLGCLCHFPNSIPNG